MKNFNNGRAPITTDYSKSYREYTQFLSNSYFHGLSTSLSLMIGMADALKAYHFAHKTTLKKISLGIQKDVNNVANDLKEAMGKYEKQLKHKGTGKFS